MIFDYLITTSTVLTTIALLSIFGFLFIIDYLLSIYKSDKRYSHIPGPKQKGLLGYIFGYILTLKAQDEKGVQFYQHFENLMSTYGKTFKFRIFKQTVIFTIDPVLVKAVYIEKNLPKTQTFRSIMGYPGGERFLGDGLVTEMDHSKWKSRRALFNPGFNRQILNSLVPVFNNKADCLIDCLKKRADGQIEIKLFDEFSHVTLDIIASVAFSMELDTVNKPNNKFNSNIFHAFSNCKEYLLDPMRKFKPNKWNQIRKHRESIRYLRETGREQLEKRLEMIKNNQELPNDILTAILKSHENHEFDVETMIDDFVTFFVAGEETTASMLASLFLELGRNEHVLEKLKSEIDSVIGIKNEISHEDLIKLKYTNCCIKETLRLWGPAALINRNVNTDIQSGSLNIPAGCRIITSPRSSCRSEEYFEDPISFKPERFMKNDDDEEKKLNPEQSFSAYLAGSIIPKDGTKCFITCRN